MDATNPSMECRNPLQPWVFSLAFAVCLAEQHDSQAVNISIMKLGGRIDATAEVYIQHCISARF